MTKNVRTEDAPAEPKAKTFRRQLKENFRHYDTEAKRFLEPGEVVELTKTQLEAFGDRFQVPQSVVVEHDGGEGEAEGSSQEE